MIEFTAGQRARLGYASFVVADARMLFVETPKAACSSFKHTIASLAGADFGGLQNSLMAAKSDAMGIHDRSAVSVPSLFDQDSEQQTEILTSESYARVCVVRNPFARLASAWADRLLCHSISPLAPSIKELGYPEYRPEIGFLREQFAEFVNHLYRKEAPHFSNHHWNTMEQLLLPDVISYNLEIRTEELAKGVAKLISHIEEQGMVWPGLPRLNENPVQLGLELHTPLTVRRVAEMYEVDFHRYGYRPKFASLAMPSIVLPDADSVRDVQQRNRRIFYLSLKVRGLL